MKPDGNIKRANSVHLQTIGGLAFAHHYILRQSSTLIVYFNFFQVFLSVLFEKSTQKHGQSCTSFGAKSWRHCLLTLAPSGVDLRFAPRTVQTTSALRTTICCQCCRFTEQIQESLCDIFQSVHTSPLAACRNAWGGKNSLRSNIMPPVSKHCSAAHCASQRCPSAVGGELPLQWRFIDIHRGLWRVQW